MDIEATHIDMHQQHVYISDQDQYGVPDKWVANLRGDCEDYALYMRHLLLSNGVDSAIWIVRTELNEMHTVLVVGDKVIDNRYTTVKHKSELNYKWIVHVSMR